MRLRPSRSRRGLSGSLVWTAVLRREALRRLAVSYVSVSSEALGREGPTRDGGQGRGFLLACSSLGRSPGSLGRGVSVRSVRRGDELRLCSSSSEHS